MAKFDYGAYQSSTAGASNYPHVQIRNPAASGKIVAVRRAWIAVDTAALVWIGDYDTALTTAASEHPAQRALSAPAAAATVLADADTTQRLTNTLWGLPSPAFPAVIEFDFGGSPVLLGEGQGLIFTHQSTNRVIYLNLAWSEYDAP